MQHSWAFHINKSLDSQLLTWEKSCIRKTGSTAFDKQASLISRKLDPLLSIYISKTLHQQKCGFSALDIWAKPHIKTNKDPLLPIYELGPTSRQMRIHCYRYMSMAPHQDNWGSTYQYMSKASNKNSPGH